MEDHLSLIGGRGPLPIETEGHADERWTGDLDTMRLLLWNVEWNGSKRKRSFIENAISDLAPDVYCLTEATDAVVPQDAHVISATEDYGYQLFEGRRKVRLCSGTEWSEVSTGNGMPPGRFVSGITSGIRFVGICVPWFDAHVSRGKQNRKRWEEHVDFLKGLAPVLNSYAEFGPVCVLGDFNQRVPATSWNEKYIGYLRDALSDRYSLDTEGIIDVDGERLIDHVATTHQLTFEIQETLGRKTDDGSTISDHPAIIGELKSLVG